MVGIELTGHDDMGCIGPYRVQNRIGAGGFAEVFAGTDTRTGQRVALKRLRLKHHGDPDSRKRFEREGLALEAIEHPNIVRCFGILMQEDEVWIVMELLRGFTLRQHLRECGPMSVDRALSVAIEVADGLADMHEMQIVHRDLKPENVFLTLPSYDVKIVDLGVAKFHGWSVPATDPGLLVCTPSYAAPEMSLGFAVDARVDVYALGLVLYEMLVGCSPFANGDGSLPVGQEALTAHLVRVPRAVSVRRRDVPPAVSDLIAQMMDKDPTLRPPAMKIVARELRRALRALRKEQKDRPPTVPTRASTVGGSHPKCIDTALILLPPVALEQTDVECREPAESTRESVSPVDCEALPLALRRDAALPWGSPLSEAISEATIRSREHTSIRSIRRSPAQVVAHQRRLCALLMLLVGTMLIGGACGAVGAVELWSLPLMPPAWTLYGMLGGGALTGVAGALLLNESPDRAPTIEPRPSAWLLAAGIAAGLLLGAGAAWLMIAPLGAPGSLENPAARSPS